MPAARYWRAIGLQSVGGGALELSALHLYLGGARVDAAATLTCTVAPESGALANLQDDDTATVCRWLDVSAPGFALVWDFGAGNTQDVSAIRLGSGVLYAEWLDTLTLQYSSDGVGWATQGSAAAFTWPGTNTLQAAPLDGDSNFSSVSLLLSLDGANNSTAFVDSSVRPKSVVASGAAKLSTAYSKFGSASLALDGSPGTAAYIVANADLRFDAADFTVDLWIRTSKAAQIANYPRMLATGNFGDTGDWHLVYLKSSGEVFLDFYSAGTFVISLSCGIVADNTWTHIAATRSGTTVRSFLNGVLQNTVTSGFSLNAVSNFAIGAEANLATSLFVGNIDDLRITKCVARYTASFTPPTVAFPKTGIGGAVEAQRKIAPIAAPAPEIISGGASAPAGPALPPQVLHLDLQDGGLHCIYGTTKLDANPTDLPVRCRVQLYNQRDNRLIRETWSDATTGDYRFDYIKGGPGVLYFVCTFDHTSQHRAVIADQIVPEAM